MPRHDWRRLVVVCHGIHSNTHALLPATRSYIFLPASFQELHQMIQEAWSSQKEKRRRIWVKLWQRPKEEPPSVQIHTNMPSSSTLRNRRLRRSIATRTRNFKARHKKTFLASKRRFLNAKQTLGEQAHDKMTSFRGNVRHSWKSLLLTEPAQADWFDSEGYPKAVRNAFGRFVNPWNSQSTNGIQSLSNFLQWRVQRFYNLHVRPKKQQSPQSTEQACLFLHTSSSRSNSVYMVGSFHHLGGTPWIYRIDGSHICHNHGSMALWRNALYTRPVYHSSTPTD